MLQIGLFMMCVYLIYKGKELVFIAAASPHEDRDEQVKSAKMWSRCSRILAVIFIIWTIAQGGEIASNL